MTPQERELITQLFDRLAALESAPRDADAERAIQEDLARAPHAVYAMVQTVLVQDEALKAANAKIEELQAQLGGPPPEQEQRPSGFLDNMRESLFGRHDTPQQHPGSVPSVRQAASPWANAPGYRDQGYRDEGPPPGSGFGGPGYGSPGYGGPGYGSPGYGSPGFGGPGYGGGQGGSFLGTAAASAAGMIGGSLLLGGIRSMLGGHQARGPFAGTFDQLGRGAGGPPGSGGTGSGGDLARRAGLDDIGRSPSGGSGAEQTRAGLFGGSDEDRDQHDSYADDHDSDGDDGDDDDDTGGDDGSDDS
jgi:hypothetical protein